MLFINIPVCQSVYQIVYQLVEKFIEKNTIINNEFEKINYQMKCNKLKLNLEKTKYTVFSYPNKKVEVPEITINNVKIDYVKEYSFLGVIIDNNLSWKQQINKVANKISKISGIVYRLKNILSVNIKKLIFNTLILSQVIYAFLAWGYNYKRIEIIIKIKITFIYI